MVKREWILIVTLLLIGVGFTFESLRLGLGGVHRPGMGFLPFYAGLGLSCAALVSLLKTFLAVERERGAASEKTYGRSSLRVAAILAALVLYILLVSVFGFMISTFLLLVFLFKVGGFRRWTSTLLAALLSISASYLLFCSWLSLRFPKGLLGF